MAHWNSHQEMRLEINKTTTNLSLNVSEATTALELTVQEVSNPITLEVSTGIIGAKGDKGDKGDTGTDVNYQHDQAIAASSWSISHNLGKYPSVTVVDSAGDVVVGEVNYVNNNSVTITFSSAFSGKAFLN